MELIMAQSSTPVKCRESRHATYLVGTTRYVSENTDTSLLIGSNTRTRNENPSWRQQVAVGANATTNYERSEWKRYTPPLVYATGAYLIPNPDWTCEGTFIHFGGKVSPYTSDDTALRDLALARFKRKLQSHYGYKNTLTPIAELRDLRRTIAGLTGLTTNFVRDLVSIRKTKGKSAFRYASDAWLNFNFGASPLVNDIASGVHSVQDFLDRKDHTFRITGTASKDWFSSQVETGGAAFLAGSLTTTAQVKHTLSYRYIGAFNALVESGNNYGLADQLGLTYKNLIPTFWELVPYSWVVDYFSTVGAFLEDTFEVPAGNLKYCLLNRRYTMEATISGKMVPYNSSYAIYENLCVPGRFEYFSLTRTSLPTVPRMALRFKTVDEVGIHAVSKLLNLSAVLIQKRFR